jgi:ribonuclease-3 family protein
MENLNLRSYAHIGDAVWELFVRKYTVYKTQNLKLLHKITTERVNLKYQAELLDFLDQYLTEGEHDISRRARNCSIPVGRRHNQFEYRKSTAFEALIGYWYLEDFERYEEIIEIIRSNFFD